MSAEENPEIQLTDTAAASRPPSQPVSENLAFKLLIPLGFLFCATTLIYIVSGMGDPELAINRFIARTAPRLLVALVAGILIDGVMAMAIDRRRITLEASARTSRDDRPE